MNKYRLNINGREVTGLPGQTILEVARVNNIFIPTLCYDERTEIYGSCVYACARWKEILNFAKYAPHRSLRAW